MRNALAYLSNLLAIFILIGILFAYAMFQGGFVSWFLFYSFLPIFIYQSVLIFYPLSNWQVSRTFSQNLVEAGSAITVVVQVKRTIPFPIFYAVIEDILPESSASRNMKQTTYDYLGEPEKIRVNRTAKNVIFIGFKRQFSLTYIVDDLPRGEHHLTALRIKISDLLGFIKKEALFRQSDIFRVYPTERELALPHGFASSEQGSRTTNSPQYQNTNMVSGVRDYAPGDRFTWIHWKQSAKASQMMTKEFEAERGSQLVLVLDASKVNAKNVLAFEAAVEMVLSLYTQIGRKNVDVELLLLENSAKYFLVPTNKALNRDVRDALIKVQPDGESLSFNLIKQRGKLAQANVVIILTTVLDAAGVELLTKMQHQLQIVVFYVQAKSFIDEKQKALIEKLKGAGILTQIFSEDELSGTKIEVKL